MNSENHPRGKSLLISMGHPRLPSTATLACLVISGLCCTLSACGICSDTIDCYSYDGGETRCYDNRCDTAAESEG
ncbi:MAG: hypothetical protein VCC00_10945 [Deltaproteobacteria bacterium]